jgi:conjugal transfer pilin signal peptidase TrbI
MASAEPLLRSRFLARLVLWAGLGGAVLALSALATFARTHALMINASPSLPHWAIWLERGAAPQRGDIVLFDPPPSPLLTRHFGEEPQPFGKRIAGVPGDRVTRHGRTFFVNGKPVAKAKTHSRFGEWLALGPTGTMPPGCYFVTTGHKDGFDSRYAAIGWICRDRILGTGRAML